MLPGEDGLAICHRLRASDPIPIPILMLTAKSDEIDRVVGSKSAPTITSPTLQFARTAGPRPRHHAPDAAHAAASAKPPLQL